MSDFRPIDLGYGRLGEPFYHAANREWLFPRIINESDRRLKSLTVPKLVLKGSQQNDRIGTLYATDRIKNLKGIVDKIPELAPSMNLLPGLTQTSEAITEIISGYDPTKSDLLAFGSATAQKCHRHGISTVPIVAVAGGIAQETVRLVLLSREFLEWKAIKDFGLRCLTARHGEEGWWTSNGGTIQQLAFAGMQGVGRPWLAVRHKGSISIIQPVFADDIEALRWLQSGTRPLPAARLYADPVVDISSHQTGGAPIADMCFNPNKNQEFGTVDQHGTWAIWSIRARSKRMNVWTVSKTCHGTVYNLSKSKRRVTDTVADGWAAMSWIANSTCLVVCTRIGFSAFLIQSGPNIPPIRISVPRILSELENDWILDLKTDPTNHEHAFVVTTTRVLWLVIKDWQAHESSGKAGASITCLQSWKHFRDRSDISLRSTVIDLNLERNTTGILAKPVSPESNFAGKDFALVLLLHSRLCSLNTAYNIYLSATHPLSSRVSNVYLVPSLEDEFIEDRPLKKVRDILPEARITSLLITPVLYRNVASMPKTSAKEVPARNMQFYKMSTLNTDLTLFESLLIAVDRNSSLTPPDVEFIKVPYKTPLRIAENFIVNEGSYDLIRPHINAVSETEDLDEDQRTLDLRWVIFQMAKKVGKSIRTFDEVLNSIEHTIRRRLSQNFRGLETFFHLTDKIPAVSDVEKASSDLEIFLEKVNSIATNVEEQTKQHARQPSVGVLKSLLPLQLGAYKMSGNHLSQAYDFLVEEWVGALSEKVPDRARVSLEKLLRNLAAEVCLATYQIVVGNLNDGFSEQSRPSFDCGQTKPVTSLQEGPSTSDLAMIPIQKISPQLTKAVPTQTPASSFNVSTSEDYASSDLQIYASLNMQPSLPQNLSNILKHWELGCDPNIYSWELAQEKLIGDKSDVEDEGKQRQRKKKPTMQQAANLAEVSSSLPIQSRMRQSLAAQDVFGNQGVQIDTSLISQPDPGSYSGQQKRKRKPGF